jgi:transcriptional regulator with XRE-family HTH domain
MLNKSLYNRGKMYGKKLKKIRNSLSLTQEKMAELLNVGLRTYVSYERDENKPPYSMLVTLCTQHKINLNWFIADVGDMLLDEDLDEELLNKVRAEVADIMKKYGVPIKKS